MNDPTIDEDPDRRSFTVCRLWEREGRTGPFLSGVWGGARVLIVKNRERADDEDAGWLLILGRNVHPAPRNPRNGEPNA